MNSSSAQLLLDSIEKTITEIDGISGSDAIVDSYLAKFLVVYISGIYEEIIENIILDYAKKNAGQNEIVNYIRTSVDKSFRNPDFSNIIGLVKKFGNSYWEDELKKMTSAQVALDSIIANKNGLAHGQGTTTTLSDVKGFYNASNPFIKKIDELLLK